MNRLLGLVAAFSFAFLSLPSVAGTEGGLVPSFIRADHGEILIKWLSAKKTYRVATDDDCRCASELAEVRTKSVGAWKARPKYRPYYTVGDFNLDGVDDFAIGIVEDKAPTTFRIVVFNGPFGPKHASKAAFVSEPLPLGQGMHYGSPRPKPFMLLVGPFQTDGQLLRPTAKGYVWDRATEQ